jgi:hypothetical protein
MNNAKRISIGPLVYADKPKKAMTMMSSAPKMAHATTSGSGRFVQFMRFFILSSGGGEVLIFYYRRSQRKFVAK